MATDQKLPALSLSSGSSLTERAAKSRAILQCETSPQQALAAAERLIGCWPHARPPDPKTYSAAISAALAAYPLGLVQECCDPRVGLARTREFPPTVAAIVAWCDERLAWHQAVAKYKPRALPAPEPPPNEEMRVKVGGLIKGLADWLKGQRRTPIPPNSKTLEQIVRDKGWAPQAPAAEAAE